MKIHTTQTPAGLQHAGFINYTGVIEKRLLVFIQNEYFMTLVQIFLTQLSMKMGLRKLKERAKNL